MNYEYSRKEAREIHEEFKQVTGMDWSHRLMYTRPGMALNDLVTRMIEEIDARDLAAISESAYFRNQERY